MRGWVHPALPAITLVASLLALPAHAQQGSGPAGRSGGGGTGPSPSGPGGGRGPAVSSGVAAPQAGSAGASSSSLAPAAPGPAPNSGLSDSDTVRDAVASGRSVPYANVLAAVGSVVSGTVVGVDLVGLSTGRLSYAVKVLTPDGDLRIVQVNARRGVVEAVR